MSKMGQNLKVAGLSMLAAASFSSCATQQLVGEFSTGEIKNGEFVAKDKKAAAIRGGKSFNTEAALTFQEEYPCGTPECAPARSRIVAGGSLKKESGSTTLAKVGQFAGGVGQATLGGAAAAGRLRSETNVEGSSATSNSVSNAQGGQGGHATSTSNAAADASAVLNPPPCN